jgi:AcrR family transcriptional regulator
LAGTLKTKEAGARRAAPRARKRNTPELVIDVAERLFGQHGLQGVSLRQIGLAAGGANHFAVQYHFGDKDKLVRAIFERRLQALESRRAKMLNEVTEAGRLGDVRALMEVLFRPIADEKNSEGRRSYAAFLVGIRHFEWLPGLSTEMDELRPLTGHVVQLIRGVTPQIPEAHFQQRILHATTVFVNAVADLDRDQAAGAESVLSEDEFIGDALDVATAALTAPPSEAVRRAFAGRSEGREGQHGGV